MKVYYVYCDKGKTPPMAYGTKQDLLKIGNKSTDSKMDKEAFEYSREKRYDYELRKVNDFKSIKKVKEILENWGVYQVFKEHIEEINKLKEEND